MTTFNSIGSSYSKTRRADNRICASLIEFLGLSAGAIIADIGAGSGNYSFALAQLDYKVKAVEPSFVMRSQARKHENLKWYEGYAEDIPLPDNSVDGVVSTLTIHHFSNLEKAFREMARISSCGSIVIFTFDPRAGKETWLTEYFPYIWDEAFEIFPPIEEVAVLLSDSTGLRVETTPFRLPADLKDNFAAAGWRNPHFYLHEDYRSNISSFQLTKKSKVIEGTKKLRAELENGEWRRKYGKVLELQDIDAGYRFLSTR